MCRCLPEKPLLLAVLLHLGGPHATCSPSVVVAADADPSTHYFSRVQVRPAANFDYIPSLASTVLYVHVRFFRVAMCTCDVPGGAETLLQRPCSIQMGQSMSDDFTSGFLKFLAISHCLDALIVQFLCRFRMVFASEGWIKRVHQAHHKSLAKQSPE